MSSPAREPAPQRNRLPLAALSWVLPPLLCLLIYWYGLRTSYQMDDYAWLGLHQLVHDFDSFIAAMFRPLAQGTIRPWSERLFFLTGWHLFGMDATPMRVAVFATMFANLALLTAIVRKLTGSAAAGLLAPALWLANANLYVPMAWTAAYNQILCACFLMGALLLWMRYTETGHGRYLAAQWIVFILGFGALELNVVYPALAGLHAFCFARAYLLRTAPMFIISAVYAVVHRAMAPPQRTEIYRMHFDGSIFATLGTYLRWTVGADRYAEARQLPEWPFWIAAGLAGLGLIVLLIWMFRNGERLALFGIGWFLAVLAPVLPLRNHLSDYYLTIPVIGLAVVAAGGIVSVWRNAGMPARTFAVAALLAYAAPSAWMAHGMTHEYFRTSQRVRTFVSSVAYAHGLHPNKILLIRNVDSDLFWAAWWDNPFRLFGRRNIWVAAEAEPGIAPFREEGSLARFFLPERLTREGLRRGDIVVYDVIARGRLRDVTPIYYSHLQRSDLPMPRYLDLRHALTDVQLGDGWYEPESNHRWMAGRAEVQLRGPLQSDGELVLRGSAPEKILENGPVHLSVEAAGHRLPPLRIDAGNLSFEFRYALPKQAVGAPVMPVVLTVDRTLRLPQEKRELGLAFATIEVTP